MTLDQAGTQTQQQIEVRTLHLANPDVVNTALQAILGDSVSTLRAQAVTAVHLRDNPAVETLLHPLKRSGNESRYSRKQPDVLLKLVVEEEPLVEVDVPVIPGGGGRLVVAVAKTCMQIRKIIRKEYYHGSMRNTTG